MIHSTLFVLTLLTTLIAGAIQQGVNLLETPGGIWHGIPFSFTLLIILAAHEFGHYFMARHHQVDVTLPYFIPAPSFIGTFGAFIKMRSPLLDRRMLLDIGAAGPVAGLAVAMPVIVVGFALSEVRPVPAEAGMSLGSSLLFSLLGWIVHGSQPRDMDIVLHPVAFSGWIGLLVTCLNLLPVGQLDGGHVAYAVLGRRQRFLARMIFVMLIILGITSWSGWLIWAAILYIMGLDHPPVIYEWVPLDRRRRVIGWASMGIFFLTFTPAPF